MAGFKGNIGKILVLMFICLSHIAWAAQPKFLIIPLTPTTLTVSTNTTATVRYQVTNQTALTRTLTLVPITGINQTTAAGTCSNPFTLAPGASCVLALEVVGSQVPTSGIHQGPTVCKTFVGGNTPDPFLCSTASPSNQLEITVNSTPTISSLVTIVNIDTRTLSICTANAITGLLEGCFNSSQFSTETITVAISNNGLFAYIANGMNSSVTLCNRNPSTGALSNCVATALGIGNIIGVSLNPSNTKLYVGGTPTQVCDVNQSTGAFSNCVTAGTAINRPVSVTINPSTNKAYIDEFESGGGSGTGTIVAICDVNPTTGTLSNCVNNSTFNGPGGLAINAAKNKLYVPNAGSFNGTSVSVCDLDPTTGLITSCSSVSGFQSPIAISLNSNMTRAFISNISGGSVSVCDILSTGNLANCTIAGTGFSRPGGLAVT